MYFNSRNHNSEPKILDYKEVANYRTEQKK